MQFVVWHRECTPIAKDMYFITIITMRNSCKCIGESLAKCDFQSTYQAPSHPLLRVWGDILVQGADDAASDSKQWMGRRLSTYLIWAICIVSRESLTLKRQRLGDSTRIHRSGASLYVGSDWRNLYQTIWSQGILKGQHGPSAFQHQRGIFWSVQILFPQFHDSEVVLSGPRLDWHVEVWI